MTSSDSDISAESTEDEEAMQELLIYTPKQMLKEGLLFARIQLKSMKKSKRKTKIEKFINRYGSSPEVHCHIFGKTYNWSIEIVPLARIS